MSWQILLFISILLSAFSTILQRVLLREEKSDPVSYSILFQFMTGLLIAIVGYVVGPMRLPDLASVSLNLVIMIGLYAGGNVLLFRALKEIEASRFTIIFSSRAIFTILASSVLLGELLTVKEFLGVVLIIAGIIYVTKVSLKLSLQKGEVLALLAAICFGLATTNDRVLLRSFEVYPYVALAFIAPAIFTASVFPKSLRNMSGFLRKSLLLKMLILSVIYSGSAITFFFALKLSSNSSQLASINQLVTVVTVLLSIIILKEKQELIRKFFASIISFIGLLLLS